MIIKTFQDLTAEEFALLSLISGKSDLISVSVRARLTPSESNAAVVGLTSKGLASKVDSNNIVLTDNGKNIKDSKKYIVHGRVGANRSYSPYPSNKLNSESI